MKKIIYFSFVLVTMLLTGCSSAKEEWQAGEAVAAGCQQVYFAKESEAAPDIMQGDASEMTILVRRNTTRGALTVPIDVKDADPQLSIPTEVAFADGEDETAVVITGPETLEEDHDYTFSLQLEGENVDPYAQLPGSTKFHGTMRLSVPVTIYCALLIGKDYKHFYHKVYLRDHKIVFPNFFNSGVKVQVGYDDSNSKITLLGEGSVVEYEETDENGNTYTDSYNTWDETTSTYGPELYAYSFIDNENIYYTTENAPYDLWFYTGYSYWYPSEGYMYLCFYSYNSDGTAGYYYLYIYPKAVADEDIIPGYPIFTNVVETSEEDE